MQEQALALSEFTIVLRMADDSIDRHCEVVSDADKCFNIRFDVVVLIFVDGLLADADSLGKLPHNPTHAYCAEAA